MIIHAQGTIKQGHEHEHENKKKLAELKFNEVTNGMKNELTCNDMKRSERK